MDMDKGLYARWPAGTSTSRKHAYTQRQQAPVLGDQDTRSTRDALHEHLQASAAMLDCSNGITINTLLYLPLGFDINPSLPKLTRARIANG